MTVRLPARPDSAALARHEVRDLLGPDAAEPFVSRCVLVVSELVADAIEHRAEPAQVDVDLTLELTRVGLSMTVSDSGEGLYIRPARRAERRLGLDIVAALACDYTISSTPYGTTIRALVPRSGA